MQEFDELVAESVARLDHTLIEQSVFGADDPALIVQFLRSACLQALGSPPMAGLFAAKNIGLSYGLQLADGRRVVVKGHQPWVRSLVQARLAGKIQAELCEAGFPAPRPLADPVPISNGGHLTIEEYKPGELGDAHSPSVRREMAERLADLIRLAQQFTSTDLTVPWLAPAEGPLWPRAHNYLLTSH